MSSNSIIHDSMIYDALVLAITKAFFEQQVYYTYDGSGNSFSHPYGGQIVEVVKQVMETPGFLAIIKRIERNINKEFDVKSIQEKALPLIMKKLEEEVNKKFRQDSFGLIRDVQDAREAEVVKMVKKAMEDKHIQDMITEKVFKKISKGEYDIDIKISVTALPKEN